MKVKVLNGDNGATCVENVTLEYHDNVNSFMSLNSCLCSKYDLVCSIKSLMKSSMTKEEAAEWQRDQRKVRNRESAAASRQKTWIE